MISKDQLLNEDLLVHFINLFREKLKIEMQRKIVLNLSQIDRIINETVLEIKD